MPSIIVRQLLANNEPAYGNSQLNFLTDADAVAQIIRTKLLFLQGEWFENLNAGTPLFQSMIGGPGRGPGNAIPLIVQQTILSTPFVTSITSFSASFVSSTRAFSFTAVVSTPFGGVTVTNQPGSAASLGL